MGTNYYVKSKTCECCGHKPEQLHIGKNSYGWSFSFHATDELMTFEDWKIYLKDKIIVDEYGDEVTLEYFIDLVEVDKDKRNHTFYCRQNHPYYSENLFLDPEGYSFTRGEFS